MPDNTVLLQQNLAVTANAVELATAVVMGAMGNAAATQIDEQPITEAFVADTVAARIQASVMARVGVAGGNQ